MLCQMHPNLATPNLPISLDTKQNITVRISGLEGMPLSLHVQRGNTWMSVSGKEKSLDQSRQVPQISPPVRPQLLDLLLIIVSFSISKGLVIPH